VCGGVLEKERRRSGGKKQNLGRIAGFLLGGVEDERNKWRQEGGGGSGSPVAQYNERGREKGEKGEGEREKRGRNGGGRGKG